jgi:hypothetical protein
MEERYGLLSPTAQSNMPAKKPTKMQIEMTP